MRLRVLLEPRYGATYDQILALAQTTEEGAAGFDAFFRSDHYMGIDPNEPALQAPRTPGRRSRASAIQTSRVTLGTLMTTGRIRVLSGQLAMEVATMETSMERRGGQTEQSRKPGGNRTGAPRVRASRSRR